MDQFTPTHKAEHKHVDNTKAKTCFLMGKNSVIPAGQQMLGKVNVGKVQLLDISNSN